MRQLLSRDASTNLGHWVHETIVNSWREYQHGTLSTWDNCYLVTRVRTWETVHERIVNPWREYQPGTLSTWDNCYLMTLVPTWDVEYMRELLTRDASTNLGHWVHETIANSWREYQPGTLSTWDNCYLVTRVPTWDTEYMRELLSRDASSNLGHWVHERIVISWCEYQPGTSCCAAVFSSKAMIGVGGGPSRLFRLRRSSHLSPLVSFSCVLSWTGADLFDTDDRSMISSNCLLSDTEPLRLSTDRMLILKNKTISLILKNKTISLIQKNKTISC